MMIKHIVNTAVTFTICLCGLHFTNYQVQVSMAINTLIVPYSSTVKLPHTNVK